jgi:polysaccharide deacetylase 2 family uncharacterized protein YibQ
MVDDTQIITDRIAPGAPKDGERAGLSDMAALIVGGVALMSFLSVGAGAITYFGSAADGGPTVSLKLTAFARGALQGEGPPPSFVDTRALSGNLIADPALLEDAPEGPLPVTARDGRAPMSAYAQTFDRSDKRPKIALVVEGLGVSTGGTDVSLKSLPSQVTFAFAPFATEVQSYVDKARGAGHEVLLQVPMEPVDFPDSDPGPHPLLVGATVEENLRRLNWALSRVTGYVGIANLLGGRFLAEAGAIEPVLAETAKRGLLFFDDGASSRSAVAASARRVNATIAKGSVILDAVQTRAAIDTKLLQLEGQARKEGFAIGVGSLYPVTLTRLADWAANASARGFVLVPITALAAQPQATASASAQ